MLNEKACAVYEYVRQQTQRGIPPTVREICRALGMKSTSTAYRYINRLVDAGYLEKIGKQNRALRMTGQQLHMIPLLREITAEAVSTALTNVRRYVCFDWDGSSETALFAWELSALVPAAGMCARDIVIVQPVETPPSNGFALAWQTEVEQVIVVPLPVKQDVLIYGRIVGLLRTY